MFRSIVCPLTLVLTLLAAPVWAGEPQVRQKSASKGACGKGAACQGAACGDCHGVIGRIKCKLCKHHLTYEGQDPWANCGCNGSYNYPVPPQYTYHWRGMAKQHLMTDYVSPWRFPPIKPFQDEDTADVDLSKRRTTPAPLRQANQRDSQPNQISPTQARPINALRHDAPTSEPKVRRVSTKPSLRAFFK